MGVWSDTDPLDTVEANTIHTQIQTERTDIIERLKCNNGTIDEHSFYGSSITGRHTISSVGFAKIHTTSSVMQTWVDTNLPSEGCLHIVSTPATLYVIYDGEPLLLSTSDHGTLNNLSETGVHTQYMKLDGTRQATADWNLTASGQLTVTTDGDNSSEGMLDDHAGLSWYSAHGVDSLITRHFADDSVGASSLYLNTVAGTVSAIQGGIGLDPSTDKYTGWFEINFDGDPVVYAALRCRYDSGSTVYMFAYSTSGDITRRKNQFVNYGSL